MRSVMLAAIVYAVAVVETALADVIAVGRVTPDLLALVAVIWTLLVPGRRTFLTAGVVGLVADLVSPGRLGVGMASFLLVGYGLSRLRARWEFEYLIGQLAAVGLATTFVALAQAAGYWLFGAAPAPPGALVTRALGVGLYTTGVAVPVLMIIGWVREPFRARRNRLAAR